MTPARRSQGGGFLCHTRNSLGCAILLIGAAATLAHPLCAQEDDLRQLTKSLVQITYGEPGERKACDISRDGRFLLRLKTSGQLFLEDISKDFEMEIDDSKDRLYQVSLDGARLTHNGDHVFGRAGSEVHVLARDSGKVIATHKDLPAGPIACYQNDTLLIGGRDGKLYMRNLTAGTELAAYEAHQQPITYVATAVIGSGRKTELLLLTGSEDQTLCVWDFARRTKKATLKLDHVPKLVAFDQRAKLLVAASESTLQVWDLAKGRKKRAIKLAAPASSVALTADGKRYVVGCADGYAQLGKTSSSKPTVLWPAYADHAVTSIWFRTNKQRGELVTMVGKDTDLCTWQVDKLSQEFGQKKRGGRKKRRR